jgi:glutathione peroxidase
MKPTITVIVVAVIITVVLGILWARRSVAADQTRASGTRDDSLYDLQTQNLMGEPVDLGVYRGKVALVVNTASKCGLTPQYAGLEALYRELAPRGLVVLGFPSNDFLNQEPGTPAEIREFCDVNYQVTFPLFAKVRVKGVERDPVYRLLTAELEEPTWNFTKYLVDRQGRVVARFGPRSAPDGEALREAILAQLAAP